MTPRHTDYTHWAPLTYVTGVHPTVSCIHSQVSPSTLVWRRWAVFTHSTLVWRRVSGTLLASWVPLTRSLGISRGWFCWFWPWTVFTRVTTDVMYSPGELLSVVVQITWHCRHLRVTTWYDVILRDLSYVLSKPRYKSPRSLGFEEIIHLD